MIEKFSPSNRLLLGSFISSFGSFCFLLAQLTVFESDGLSLFNIGIFIAVTRGVSLLVMYGVTKTIDSVNERTFLILTELACLICSVILFFLWPKYFENFNFYVAIAAIRSGLIGIQSGGRNKMLKAIGGDSDTANTNLAIWLNKASHGSIFFAAATVFTLATKVDFRWFILIDGISFLLNAYIVWTISLTKRNKLVTSISSLEVILRYFQNHRYEAILDLVLALNFSGLMVFTARASKGSPLLFPLMSLTYGGTVWLSGWIYKRWNKILSTTVSWFLISVGFCTISIFHENRIILLISYFFVCMGYWYIFHHVTACLQKNAGHDVLAGVMTARNLTMLTVIVLGEFLMGLVFHGLSMTDEGILRGAFALLALGVFRWVKKES